jgi:bifunctional DNA-binding transcriptional regulator/antitoxin component of YhaV-PrlF toxin-antitoxin module
MKTKVNKASSTHEQLRSTIPSSIAEKLGINAGDEIDWDLDKVDGVWIATIKKILE